MTRAEMPGSYLPVFGRYVFAYAHATFASGVELAARGRIDGRGNIAFQYHSVHFYVNIGHWNGGKERLCIGMESIVEYLFLGAVFHETAQIHPTSSEMCFTTDKS